MNAHPESLAVEIDESRYEIERKLGAGGAGTVYLARDLETGEQVALKKLFRMDAKSVLRLKREFRSLVDINHRNIIKLYDMGRSHDGWFLTMEYLEGAELTRYLSGADPSDAARATPSEEVAARVLSSFTQLAHGMRALHQAGMLHRDLKPSNVLVVDDRVVVLDFGLVRELNVASSNTLTEDGSISGTPAYMAPEQIRGEELTAASDWYAFGAMLYEALSGVLPFDGQLLDILRRKLEYDPMPVHEFLPAARRDVLDLCMALLHRDPAQRPDAEQVLAVLTRGENLPANTNTTLAHTGTETNFQTETEARARSRNLFGRQRELQALHDALMQALAGTAVVVHVRGASGTGKTAMVERFLDDIEASGPGHSASDVLVLRSRCHELEAMPFKALDGAIDALVRYLSRLDDLEVAHLLPPNLGALIQVFPALERLAAAKRLSAVARSAHDAVLDRQRAEFGLRALLDVIAVHKPIVLWIDDLQWGDLDSARILKNWLTQPARAPILFVFSYRSEEISTNSCLAHVLEHDASALPTRALEHTIDVGELPDSEIQALCEQRIGNLARMHTDVLARIVREAQGSPFLATQLAAVAEVKLTRGDTDWSGLTIDALVAQASSMLAPEAQQLLALLAVAGRPMPPKLALRAAAIGRNGRALVHALRGLNLVRMRDVSGERMLEVYHDRVRERVKARLSTDEHLALCNSLLNTLAYSRHGDPDWMMALALNAGQRAKALAYGRAAAERANTSLAFGHAAEVYRRCIELAEAVELAGLWSMLATALERCGRGTEAADAYLAAAKLAAAPEALTLTLLAAAHLLRSGRFEQGEALRRKVLEDAGIRVPESDRQVMAAIAWERVRLKMRGMDFQLRSSSAAPRELLARYDLLEALCTTALHYDPLRGTLFQVRAMRCALDAGEPGRLVLSLCRAANVAASASRNAGPAVDALIERAEQLVRRGDVQDQNVVLSTRGMTNFVLGRHQQAVEFTQRALQEFRNNPQTDTRANYYRRHVVTTTHIAALYQLAQYKPFLAELNELLREAHATDNRALLLNLALAQTHAEELTDTCAISQARLDRQREELPQNSFGLLHVVHMSSVLSLASATREYAWAQLCLDRYWQRYVRSPIDRGGWFARALHAERARLLLNRYHAERKAPQLLAAVRQDLNWLQKRGAHDASGRILARLAHIAGDARTAIELLSESSLGFQSQGLVAEGARDRYALGVLMAGSEGRSVAAAALQRLHELGTANSQLDLRAYYPEFATVDPR